MGKNKFIEHEKDINRLLCLIFSAIFILFMIVMNLSISINLLRSSSLILGVVVLFGLKPLNKTKHFYIIKYLYLSVFTLLMLLITVSLGPGEGQGTTFMFFITSIA